MPKKLFHCVKCGGVHERPINSKCKVVIEKYTASINENVTNVPESNAVILQELKNLSNHMTAIEQKVNEKDSNSTSPSVRSSVSHPLGEDDDLGLPSIATLRLSKQIQKQVDNRVKQLQAMNEQGKFKSQRGGSETVYIKKEVPWPHNYVLGGSKNLGSPMMSQWIAGFSQIIRKETCTNTRNNMVHMTILLI